MDLLHNPEIFKAIAESAPVHIIVTDTNGIIVYANPEVETITGYSREECIGKNPRLWGGLMRKEYYANMWTVIQGGDVFEGKIINQRKDRKKYTATVKICPITGDNKTDILGYIGIEQDLSRINQLTIGEFEVRHAAK